MKKRNLSFVFRPRSFYSVMAAICLVLCLSASMSYAQDKKEEVILQIKNLSWNSVNTPDYSVTASERTTRLKKWTRIETRYDTAPDWIDELEFRYYVVVHNPHKKTEDKYLMFTRTIFYVDIAKGRDHLSTVFLRPNTVERHGDVDRIAVEIYNKGKKVASHSTARSDDRDWWLLPGAQAMNRVGYLWTRPETPFAFVAYDLFEQIRQ